MPVSIITDTAASIPDDLVDTWGVHVVPLHLRLDGVDVLDGSMPLESVLARDARQVTTSGVTPGQIEEAALAADDGDGVVVVTIAGTMSSTFEAARLAAGDLGARGMGIEVVDSRTAAGAQGLVVEHAARVARLGADRDAVALAAREAAARVRLVATVDGLDRLVASGRVPGLAGLAGKLVNVNPLFEFRDGSVHRMRPAFTRDAALDRIVSRWRRSREPDAALHVAALHALDRDPADRLLKQVDDAALPATEFVGAFSSVMVAHTGPGLVGLAWWWEPQAGSASDAGA